MRQRPENDCRVYCVTQPAVYLLTMRARNARHKVLLYTDLRRRRRRRGPRGLRTHQARTYSTTRARIVHAHSFIRVRAFVCTNIITMCCCGASAEWSIQCCCCCSSCCRCCSAVVVVVVVVDVVVDALTRDARSRARARSSHHMSDNQSEAGNKFNSHMASTDATPAKTPHAYELRTKKKQKIECACALDTPPSSLPIYKYGVECARCSLNAQCSQYVVELMVHSDWHSLLWPRATAMRASPNYIV